MVAFEVLFMESCISFSLRVVENTGFMLVLGHVCRLPLALMTTDVVDGVVIPEANQKNEREIILMNTCTASQLKRAVIS